MIDEVRGTVSVTLVRDGVINSPFTDDYDQTQNRRSRQNIDLCVY